jgi:hypothetical protein
MKAVEMKQEISDTLQKLQHQLLPALVTVKNISLLSFKIFEIYGIIENIETGLFSS